MREQQRNDWLRDQINNGKYLNKLNKVYKDNVSQLGDGVSQSPSKIGLSNTVDRNEPEEHRVIGKHGILHEKQSIEKT